MASERIPMPQPTLDGIADALRRAYPMPRHDAEEQAERHELRKLDIAEAVKRPC